ncbi:MAG: radical SAM protein [Bacteroidetes bacterium]|nr:radical SAM protein [Bacteroidota bacterium]
MPREIRVSSVLNKTRRRDNWFLDDYTLNLYSSCAFNCLYCYIRGSKYGTNLAESLSAKANAIEVLDKQLKSRAKKGQYGYIVLSSATDPYLRIEKDYRLTRQALELILEYRFPVHIITKSDMVSRDYDLLKEIDKRAILPVDLEENPGRGTIITYSFSTLEDAVGRIFEPGATPPSKRLISLQDSLDAGFLSGVSLMPLLPFISDTAEQLELAFSAFRRIGARYVMPAQLTLFGSGKADSKVLMLKAIKKHYPELEKKYQYYFRDGSEMPEFYKVAFAEKLREMRHKYQMPHRIIGP